MPWTPAVTLSHGHDRLSAWRMAVFCTFRKPSLCRHVHRELLRNTLLDLTPIVPATACHQRNYVETYSRFNLGAGQSRYGGGTGTREIPGTPGDPCPSCSPDRRVRGHDAPEYSPDSRCVSWPRQPFRGGRDRQACPRPSAARVPVRPFDTYPAHTPTLALAPGHKSVRFSPSKRSSWTLQLGR